MSSRQSTVPILLALILLPATWSGAVDTIVKCGDAIEADFAPSQLSHAFRIDLQAGDQFSVDASVLGQTLRFARFLVKDPIGESIVHDGIYQGSFSWKSPTLSASGRYQFVIEGRTVGKYNLLIGCTLSNGTEIPPGGKEVRPTTADSAALTGDLVSPGLGLSPPTSAQSLEEQAKLTLENAGKEVSHKVIGTLKNRLIGLLDGRKAGADPEMLYDSIETGVVLFDKAALGGQSEFFDENDPDLADNILNDRTTSVWPAPGCQAILYKEPNYRGARTTIKQKVDSLKGTAVGNNAVSSLEVQCNRGVASTP